MPCKAACVADAFAPVAGDADLERANLEPPAEAGAEDVRADARTREVEQLLPSAVDEQLEEPAGTEVARHRRLTFDAGPPVAVEEVGIGKCHGVIDAR
jgi:hypothetical protein